MGTKTVYVSDLTDQEADETDLGHLTVMDHPEFREPITLEALPDEVKDLEELEEKFVSLEWRAPLSPRRETLIVRLEDFNRLAKHRSMDEILADRSREQRQSRSGQPTRGRRSREGQQQRSFSPSSEKTDYASPEHAGKPHRGRATEAEAQYVRSHLSEVNTRLRAEGLREIDASDPKMQERFGLSPTAQPAGSRSS